MTTLVRWSPFQELDAMERRMRRLFGDLGLVPATLPATDVYETDAEFVFEVEAPGFDKEHLTIEVVDHTLLIKGEQMEEKEQEDKAFRLHERLEKTFERRFELPVHTEPQKIAADFDNGVLTIHAPKAEIGEPRTITIGDVG
jgi:HSP20 family protein